MVYGNIWVVFVRSGCISEGFRSGFKEYDRTVNKIRIWRAEDCEIHAQRGYNSFQLDAEGKMLIGSVTETGEADQEVEVWMTGVVLLCPWSVRRDTGCVELVFVQYRKRVPLFDAAHDERSCVYMQRVTAGNGEDESKMSWAVKENDPTVVGQCFGATLLRRSLGMHKARKNFARERSPQSCFQPVIGFR